MADKRQPGDPDSFMTLAEVRALVHLSPNKLRQFTNPATAEALGLPLLRVVKFDGSHRVARVDYERWAAELQRRGP